MNRYLLFLIVMCLFTFVSKAQISGVIYRDYNGNGTRQLIAPTIEPGLPGVTIQAYNASNVLISSTVSGNDGSYTLPFSVPVRIECIIPANGNCTNASLDAQGAINDGNNIRFVTASTNNLNFAIQHAADFVSNTNPLLFVPQFTNGDPLGGGSAGTARVYAGVNYTQSGTSAPAMTLSGINIGSVWGNVYSGIPKNKHSHLFNFHQYPFLVNIVVSKLIKRLWAFGLSC